MSKATAKALDYYAEEVKVNIKKSVRSAVLVINLRINPFGPTFRFLYPLIILENLTVFLFSQGV